MRVLYILIVCCVCKVASDKEDDLENSRKNLLEQLLCTRTVLREGYHLVTRQIASEVHKFRSYRFVSVVFFPIVRDVTEALFTFQSEELHLNAIGSCSPQEVVVNLKHGTYPAVNPDGYDFPKNFIDPAIRDEIYTIDILSDGNIKTFTIQNPKPGNWYALVYIKWEDPRTQKVKQEGLVAHCQTLLYTDLQIKRHEDIKLVDCYSGITVDTILPVSYKCMSIDSTSPISLNITLPNYKNSSKVLFMIQALSLPSEENYLVSCVFEPNVENIHTIITFSPNPSSWHYIYLEEISNNTSSYADCESYLRSDESETDVSDFMRDDKARFFTFDYGLPTENLDDVTSIINITSDDIKTLRFNVNQFIDIGGSVTIECSLLMSLKYFMGYKRELKKGALLAFTQDNQFLKVVVCLDIGHASTPLETGECKFNYKIKPALFVLNSTDSETIYEKTIIPFPESGLWYMTFRLFCDEVVCPCPTSHNGSKYYVETNLTNTDGEDISGEFSKDLTREGQTKCNATVVVAITSSSCVAGRCSNNGNCLLNNFGGLVMSFCSCYTGYGAWDCSDKSRMESNTFMLVSVLLLTLSNMLFIFSIYVAIVRCYYAEAVMYAFTMVFSTFYHACDADAKVAYCITRLFILQFGDFYCGIMSFWVTLLAMCIISDNLRASFYLIGAIVIALLTTWDMHSIVAFMTPVAVGVSLLIISWLLNYRKTHSFLYPKTYYTRHMPLGIVLVAVGLVCYAFLQTEQNYKIVHSFWHMTVALSVGFLLPDVKRGGEYNAFVPSGNICKLPIFKVFHRSTA